MLTPNELWQFIAITDSSSEAPSHSGWVLPPFSLRSKGSTRKPLRSSPLAGPVLSHYRAASSEEHLAVHSDAVSNTSSTVLPTTPPSCHVRPKSSHSIGHPVISIKFDSKSTLSPNVRRRTRPLSAMQTSQQLPSTYIATESFDVPVPNIPDWAIIPSSSTSRSSQTTYPHSTDNIGSSSNSMGKASKPSSCVQDNSWYTANPYEITPRFSRLSLSAKGIVMPVSAKGHQRLPMRPNSANTNSSPSPVSYTPSLRTTRSNTLFSIPKDQASCKTQGSSRPDVTSRASSPVSSSRSDVPSLSLTRSSSADSSVESLGSPPESRDSSSLPPSFISASSIPSSALTSTTTISSFRASEDTAKHYDHETCPSLLRHRNSFFIRARSMRFKPKNDARDNVASTDFQEFGMAFHRTGSEKDSAAMNIGRSAIKTTNAAVMYQSDSAIQKKDGGFRKLWRIFKSGAKGRP
ncbi:hypothetical protein B0H34DRAFT_263043 [Crassisporium funariophilum]|nr:hypothetical protein B0H34DRAFT_263043 [Crassisporium funariophilum]